MKKMLLLCVLLLLSMPLIAQESDSDEPEQIYAPYVYMARYPVIQLATTAEETGIRYFSLAFILSGVECDARWSGTVPIEESFISNLLISDLEALRELGGDVIISFGGWSGVDLAERCEDVDSLVEQYQRVIDVYGVTRLDFDIEGDDINNPETLARRLEAIAQLQENNREMGHELIISFTLPVRPTGLTEEGIYVIEEARDAGVDIDIVNIMTMNFGEGFPSDEMGENTIQAAESLVSQLQEIYPDVETDDLWGQVGITPMVGINDRQSEIFQLEDAQMVLEFAEQQGIRVITIWSLDRDIQCEWVDALANDCSGIQQDPFAFSAIFNTILDE